MGHPSLCGWADAAACQDRDPRGKAESSRERGAGEFIWNLSLFNKQVRSCTVHHILSPSALHKPVIIPTLQMKKPRFRDKCLPRVAQLVSGRVNI